MWRKVVPLAFAGAMISAPVQAQMRIAGCCIWVMNEYGYWRGYRIDGILFLLLIVLGLVGLAAWCFDQANSCDTSEADAAADQAQRYEEEARRLRALKQRTDAETELTASLIDKARINAAYNELNQITQHDREVRRLSRRT
jgi:hypothetical protein